jgi:UDP-N-acetyl-D-galactosamine dehydrogenase
MSTPNIAVIGLGYVGLPLAVEFGKHYDTVGFDINETRVAELRQGVDRTLEASAEDIKSSKKLVVTTDINDLKPCDIYIVTVPTPIDAHNRPDLTPIETATETVAQVLEKDDIVVFRRNASIPATRNTLLRKSRKSLADQPLRLREK